jgi:hypothetical protein
MYLAPLQNSSSSSYLLPAPGDLIPDFFPFGVVIGAGEQFSDCNQLNRQDAKDAKTRREKEIPKKEQALGRLAFFLFISLFFLAFLASWRFIS